MQSKVKLFFSYLGRIRPYFGFLTVAFISDISLSLITMLPPLFSVAIFDYAYPYKNLGLFTFFIIAGLVIYFLDVFLSASIDYINTYVDRQMEYDLSNDLFLKIEQLPLQTHAKNKIGDLIVRLTDDVYQIVDLLTGFFPVLLVNLAKLGFFLFIAFKMDPKITILALCSIPLYIIETKFFSDKLEDIQTKTQETEARILDCIQERLLNIRTIKAFSQEKSEAHIFGKRVLGRFKISIKQKLTSIISLFANSITLKVWAVFISWYLGYELINGNLTIGELVALMIYLPMLEEPISELSRLYANSKVCMVSLARVDRIFGLPNETKENNLLELTHPKGEIKFDKLSFKYESKFDALSDINLDIPKNSSVAIVGASGSGKTTLVNLLMRFYPVKDGAIYIDGKNISEIKLDSLRKNIGAVFQEISLFEGTIRDNISYGSKNKSEEEIINAAKTAQIHDFITGLPTSYDFWIKPQGVNLSGGQRQRISLARIFLYDPKIIIMDEATSSIDPESEFLIQETIYKCMGNKTLIIIAHKLSTIKKVDKIIVLDQGKIAEEGTFEDLLNKKGLFFRLYDFQFGGFEVFRGNFEREFQRYTRYNQDLCLIAMEVDNFEILNKKYSFDELLKFMNELNIFIRQNLRGLDFSTVFQEKQLLMVLPYTSKENAEKFCLRINKLLKDKKLKINHDEIPLSLTMGVASCKDIKPAYSEDLLEKSIEALVTAKKHNLKIGIH